MIRTWGRTWTFWLVAPAVCYFVADQFYFLTPHSWGIPFEFLWSVVVLSLVAPCQISWLVQETESLFSFPDFGWKGNEIFEGLLFLVLALPIAIWLGKQLTQIHQRSGLRKAILWYAVPSILVDAMYIGLEVWRGRL